MTIGDADGNLWAGSHGCRNWQLNEAGPSARWRNRRRWRCFSTQSLDPAGSLPNWPSHSQELAPFSSIWTKSFTLGFPEKQPKRPVMLVSRSGTERAAFSQNGNGTAND
jgi:hypothetical protein